RAGGSEKGGAGTIGPRCGLDEGVHDAPFVERQARSPGDAADADGGRTAGDCRRGTRLGKESGVPRVQRRGTAASVGRRLRLDRARSGDYGYPDRADGEAGDMVLPDNWRLLCGLGAGKHAGGTTRPAAGEFARDVVSQGGESEFANRIRHGHRRNSVAGTDCGRVQVDDEVRDEPDGSDSVGELASRGDAGGEGGGGRGERGRGRGRDCGERRSVEGYRRTGKGEVCDEGWGGVQG